MQTVPIGPIPLFSSLSLNNLHNPNKLIASAPPNYQTKKEAMPKCAYNETAISTELECFITKSSSSDSIRMVEDDINDIELSSDDSHINHDTIIQLDNDLEDTNNATLDTSTNGDLKSTNTVIDMSKRIKMNRKSKYNKRKRRKHGHCNMHPQWLLYLSSLDKLFSDKIHKLSCGSIDYLFVFGAFVFGSKFM
eukprot:395005_1